VGFLPDNDHKRNMWQAKFAQKPKKSENAKTLAIAAHRAVRTAARRFF
jgi:hypothetical protein